MLIFLTHFKLFGHAFEMDDSKGRNSCLNQLGTHLVEGATPIECDYIQGKLLSEEGIIFRHYPTLALGSIYMLQRVGVSLIYHECWEPLGEWSDVHFFNMHDYRPRI